MHAVEYVNRQFGMMRGLFNATTEDLTEEQVNSAPPGVANSIGTALLHLVGSEDAFVQQVILGRPMIWERDGWSDRIGVSRVPGPGDDWSELRAATLSLAAVRAYEQAVRAATDGYLGDLTADELDRTVKLGPNDRQVADVLVLAVVHNANHTGDIATLKGVLGAQGLPF